ncbi:sn-glycerol-3-phosphate import ATP-binding protein UgpC [Fundidesulfovibrio magnetotacticus]|uniref:sn-glycerol-3-phosphate import ATP-binding protein UgpC n=1 Tax=Fundidesulfovibrio magnetotacticus TaxID=2730080 RepID=A0A6V8LNZ9_9BACT|nr:ABC transporter ATP-binding protein [Fundidesulfovibrio magnetotacticus]GFK93444.1 sn-glycerol-3-phosphate import ATP-binding protein UgpC [Fundidesulfovibrio magnetotacticus]
MPQIRLESVSRHWGQVRAVDDVSFVAPEGSLMVLLGPSGCGKSTTLRLIAGLETVSSGRIFIADKDVTGLSPSERRLAMVFQSYALFPHLNVRENILFGLKVRKVPRDEQARRLDRAVGILGLGELLDRKPAALSGGQQQRVALGRALVAETPVCLMDEPLSNLDAKLRQEMRREIRALQLSLGMTMVYVTHDQTEAMSMADRIILMQGGGIVQNGTPEELYTTPASLFAASFIGTPPMNLVRLASGPDGIGVRGASGAAAPGAPHPDCFLGIRPEHLEISAEGNWSASVLSVEYLGVNSVVSCRVGDQTVCSAVEGMSRLGPGQEVRLRFDESRAHYFHADTGLRIGGRDPRGTR